MSLFGLDPDSVGARVRASPAPRSIPTFAQSLWVGSLGFGFVSLVVYSLWAFAGKPLSRNLGEGGFFAVCALVFIGLAGLVLRRLVIGPRVLGRFYGLFAAGFGAYAVAWCLAWFLIGGKVGEWLGSLAGTSVLALILTGAFSATGTLPRAIMVLFVTHSAGYFVGEIVHASIRGRTGMLLWGVAYGLGFGLGLGYVLYRCQEPIRTLLTRIFRAS